MLNETTPSIRQTLEYLSISLGWGIFCQFLAILTGCHCTVIKITFYDISSVLLTIPHINQQQYGLTFPQERCVLDIQCLEENTANLQAKNAGHNLYYI
jgi:hypothetical protein